MFKSIVVVVLSFLLATSALAENLPSAGTRGKAAVSRSRNLKSDNQACLPRRQDGVRCPLPGHRVIGSARPTLEEGALFDR